MITERAPAKINLYLHITGKQADGLHLLDSLAVFAADEDEAADKVTLTPAPRYGLTLAGPYGAALQGEDPEKNLITKALRSLAAARNLPLDFTISLEKNLPVASGIGGGSSDAAAALRAAARHYGLGADDTALHGAAQSIGSDGVVCYRAQASYMGGTGNLLAPVAGLPRTFMLLANPNIPLPTGPVYQARTGAFTPAQPLERKAADARDLAAMLEARRNDLQPPAIQLCPTINDVLAALAAQEGCLLARLSGSGATCFALFETAAATQAARAALKSRHPSWWLVATSF